MAKFQTNDGEQLLGEADASHIKTFLLLPQANPGKLHVTNQRVVFTPTRGRMTSAFAHDLEEIASFSVGAMSTITLTTKNGESHKITGMFNKKLIEALTAAGVQKA